MLYILPGDPHTMARPRFTRKTIFDKGHAYDPQYRLKHFLAIHVSSQHGDAPPYNGPLLLVATFFFKIPDRIAKRLRPDLINKPAPTHKDLDNLLKLVADVSQIAGVFENDSQICKIIAQKIYCEKDPRTEFELSEL